MLLGSESDEISDLLLLLFCFLGRSMQIYEISLGDGKKKQRKQVSRTQLRSELPNLSVDSHTYRLLSF